MEVFIILLLLFMSYLIILYNTILNYKNNLIMHFTHIKEYEIMKEDILNELIHKSKNKKVSDLKELLNKKPKKTNDELNKILEINNILDEIFKKEKDKDILNIKKAINDIDNLIKEKAMYYNESLINYNYSYNNLFGKLIVNVFNFEKYEFIERY